MEQKFIAVSEEEYNSFKHGEYERKIKELQEKIKELEKEKIEIAKAKAVKLEKSNFGDFNKAISTVEVYSDSDFENEILNDIKNTEFKHVVEGGTIGIFGFFDKDKDYVQIGDNFYYQNEWCERIKENLRDLSSKVKDLEERRDKLAAQVEMLEDKLELDDDGCHLDRKESFIKRIIDKFGK